MHTLEALRNIKLRGLKISGWLIMYPHSFPQIEFLTLSILIKSKFHAFELLIK
jgi:hypothetical protein